MYICRKWCLEWHPEVPHSKLFVWFYFFSRWSSLRELLWSPLSKQTLSIKGKIHYINSFYKHFLKGLFTACLIRHCGCFCFCFCLFLWVFFRKLSSSFLDDMLSLRRSVKSLGISGYGKWRDLRCGTHWALPQKLHLRNSEALLQLEAHPYDKIHHFLGIQGKCLYFSSSSVLKYHHSWAYFYFEAQKLVRLSVKCCLLIKLIIILMSLSRWTYMNMVKS